MTSKRYFSIPMVAGALGVGGAAMVARAAEPTTAELQAQIQALQTKVQQLETQSPQQQQQTATINSVLSDANKRSQLMEVEGFTAGHTGGDDGHFVIQSGDGNFRMVPWLQLQFRNVLNYTQNGQSNGKDTFEDGFEINRAKIGFMGNVFSPDITYNINWASGENNGGAGLVLENAYMQFHCPDHDAWSLRAGQWKDVVFHEENVSSKRQLAVDRSLANEVIGGARSDYVQGVAVIWDNHGPLRAEVAYHDGINSDNTSYMDTPTINGFSPSNFGVAGRVEWAMNGNFKGYDQFTARGNQDDLLVIGGAFDWTQAGSDNVILHTVDGQWAPQSIKGLALYAAYLGAFTDFNNGPGNDDSTYDWGFILQGAYMLNDKWEAFARFSYTSLDADFPGFSLVEDNFYEITLGANYYMHGHSAKFTIDASILPNGTPIDSSAADYQTSDGDTEVVVRAQFQILL